MVNNRWSDPDTLIKQIRGQLTGKPEIFYDFETPEYSQKKDIWPRKWETCRGLGRSFGFDRQEGPEQTLSAKALIDLLIDIVSKNGNLLIDVGAMADGTIPDIQVDRLRALGKWLGTNGEAIFDTRPWSRAEGKTKSGIDVRFTRKGDVLYAILLGRPRDDRITIENLRPGEKATVEWLATPGQVEWKQDGEAFTVTVPDKLPESHAYALRITGVG